MKKILRSLLIISSLFLLLFIQSTPVLARVGGGSGGGGSSHTSTSSNNDDYEGGSFLGYTRLGPYVFDNDNTLLILLLLSALGSQSLAKKRWNKKKGEATPLDPQTEKQATDLFYKVEEAWDQQDKRTLASCMTRRYYFNQARLLMRWKLFGKINHVDSIDLVTISQLKAHRSNQMRLLITGQARDWFENRYHSSDYNQAQENSAQIERFTEIWRVVNTNRGLLIKQITPINEE